MPAISVSNVLFLDIETVPQFSSHEQMPEEWKTLWSLKAQYLLRNQEETETPATIYPRAGIYAEFGRIICISCGYITGSGADKKISIKSFYGDDEKTVLLAFSEMLGRWASDSAKFLCAHNGKEFDFPYLCRRLVINRLPMPPALQLSGKKPWEVNHLDTMELWKFGDFKSYTSLNLLAHALDIATPKDDIDGSMVWEVYWKERDIQRIVTYCQKDVITVAQIYLRLNGEALISEGNIEIKA